jgi:PII-like signaling protein
MKGKYLKIYVNRMKKHRGILLYEWLLEKAKEQGLPGGSAFQAIAGFGMHGVLHEEHFYELGGNVPVMVCFVVSDEQGEAFLSFLKKEKVEAFYHIHPTEYEHLH